MLDVNPGLMRKFFVLLLFLFIGLASYLYHYDDLRSAHISSFHTPRSEWENSPPSELEAILAQPFTFEGEGGQSYVFSSADGKYVLKVFKFRRFRPSPWMELLPSTSSYYLNHAQKREAKWLLAFNAHQLAYKSHREASGLVYVQLNGGINHALAVTDKWGFSRTLELKSVPFIVQKKGETLGHVLQQLLNQNNIEAALHKLDQLFDLYLSEYQKGIYDTDYGIMHNIGVIEGELIHLDVGKMVYDEKMKQPVFWQHDLKLVSQKIYRWAERHFSVYAAPIRQHLELKLTTLTATPSYLIDSYSPDCCKNIFYSSIYSNYQKQRQHYLLTHPLYHKQMNLKAEFTPSNRISVSRERSDVGFGEEGIALAIAEERNATSDLLTGNRKLIEGVNSADLKPLMEIIMASSLTPLEQRENHQAFVTELRKLLISPPEGKTSQQLVNDLVKWTYLKGNLQPLWNDFFNQKIFAISSGYEPLPTLVQNTYLTVRENPEFSGTKYLTKYEDQFLDGNLPSLIADIGSTRLIRMAQPTRFYRPLAWLQSPTVQPEALAFLQGQPSHLYVNVMKRFGMEKAMSRAIESLEQKIKRLYVVTLDKNSSYYWQQGTYAQETLSPKEFKAQFLQELFSGRYYWSKKLDRVAWEAELKKILNQVQTDYFHGLEALNSQDRQDFIELSYLKIVDRLVEKWQPASMNITCRQCIDRGPSLSTLWLYSKQIYTDSQITDLLLSPPVVIHNRPSFRERVNRFTSAAARLVPQPMATIDEWR